MTQKRILLLMGRDDWHKDEALMQTLLKIFTHDNYKLIHENPATTTKSALLKIKERLPKRIQPSHQLTSRLAELLYAIAHPKHFHYLYHRKKTANSVDFRCRRLTKMANKLPATEEIIILSRSSGGRVSSLVADTLKFGGVICLGYPFKHPEKHDEPERYLHLSKIKTPTLIIQGIHDPYGGADIETKYKFSKNIEVHLANENHDFNTNSQELKTVTVKIKEWLQREDCSSLPR